MTTGQSGWSSSAFSFAKRVLLVVDESFPVGVLVPQVPVVVVGHDHGVVVQGRLEDEPVVVGQHELVLDEPRRRVGQVAFLLEFVENLRIQRRTLVVRAAAPKARHQGFDVRVAPLHEIVHRQLDSLARERLLVRDVDAMSAFFNNKIKCC